MGNQYGSVWHRWDFHVHTPYSILNNGYGFNPYEANEAQLELQFDNYVRELLQGAIDNDISAIGLTDYFLLDGYKKIYQDYLCNSSKMEALFPDKEFRDKIRELYIFPNIEFRVDTFVGREANAINYHVLFSNELDIEDIEENFLHQLKFEINAGELLSLTKTNLKKLGEQIKNNNHVSGDSLLVGLKHVTISYASILEILRGNSTFFDKYIITVPVDEDLSTVSWSGRDYMSRKNIYQQCHCYLTSNSNTIKWALAHGEEKERIAEFGPIKPCIWGSDAHSFDTMFKPSEDRYCWIKSELTFAGLLQILYEPSERVFIQKENPDNKDPHNLIESISFNNVNFQTEPIVFNSGLTCIIGGKSTGKSLLLHYLANGIDAEHCTQREKTAKYRIANFPPLETTIMWKDGTSESRKIIYVPQTFLNKSIDNPEESSEIQKIIADVLLQEPEIATAKQKMDETISVIGKQVSQDIYEYCEKIKQLHDLDELIKAKGTSDVFSKVLKELEQERTSLAAKVKISESEIERYKELEEKKRACLRKQTLLQLEIDKLEKMQTPQIVIPGYYKSKADGSFENTLNEEFPCKGVEIEKILEDIQSLTSAKWVDHISQLLDDTQKQLAGFVRDFNDNKSEYEILKSKMDQNEQLQKLSTQIQTEQKRLDESKKLLEQRKALTNRLSNLRAKIISSQNDYKDVHKAYTEIVISVGTRKKTNLTFSAQVNWKMKEFQDGLIGMLDNRNFSAFRNEYNYDLNSLEIENYDKHFLESLWKATADSSNIGSLSIKSGHSFETVLSFLFRDWYNIHYVVKSENDTIDQMSPGKKALVLLEMLISLESSTCPILIDQPEDDLDNRSIFNDLVQYIKEKKKERQIIVVTHNANIVLGADADEVIIANQDGSDSPNRSRHFEYRSGAIENNQILVDEEGHPLPDVLSRKGIQSQICDILEGGTEAFKLRQNKYRSNL